MKQLYFREKKLNRKTLKQLIPFHFVVDGKPIIHSSDKSGAPPRHANGHHSPPQCGALVAAAVNLKRADFYKEKTRNRQKENSHLPQMSDNYLNAII